MANFSLVISKIVDIARTKKSFAFSLGTFRAIDPSIHSLSEAQDAISDTLSSTYTINVVYSARDQLLVFFTGAKTTVDMIPPELVGARYSAPAPVIPPAVFEPAYTPVQPVQPTAAYTIIDTRFCTSPFTNVVRRSVNSYGNSVLANFAGAGLRHNIALSVNSKGYIFYPATSDMRTGYTNYTYDVVFKPESSITASVNSIKAIPIIDTRNRYNEGFVVEFLAVRQSNGILVAWLRLRERNQMFTYAVDGPTLMDVSRAVRVTIVRNGSQKYLYYNGIRLAALATSENYSASNIYLGAYSPYQALNIGDGYPRVAVGGTHNLFTKFESFSLHRLALYMSDFNYYTTFS